MKLHITNGDVAAELIRSTDLEGLVLPWRDVLHEGPVPAGLAPAELAELRSDFLAELGGTDRGPIRQDFAARDATLARLGESDRIVLWFEHDLYDQLQLIQILDRLADSAVGELELIVIDEHPSVERFRSLGQLTPAQLSALYPQRQPVTVAQLDLARRAWRAFGSPGLEALRDLATATPDLPLLAPALRRHLEQFPSVDNGLGRTEQQVLTALVGGPLRAGELFRDQQAAEAAPFLGDTTFWTYLRRLAVGAEPLVELSPADSFGDTMVALTSAGGRVSKGEADQIALNGIDRWFGGVHLQGHRVAAAYRFDARL
ncbi:MAG: DUF1835 domain-containing protein [Acidobacteriota bacterium]